MIVFIFFAAIWYLSLFSQTFFQHRYAAHGAFSMSKGWERFFFIFTYLTQGSSYMSPRAYAVMHRLHHAHTDTELDPHSPSNSSNIFSMMWDTRTVYQQILHNKIEVEAKYTKNLPEWGWFDRFANSTLSRLLWVAVYVAFFVVFATNPYQYLLLPIVVTMGAFHGAIVNWFAHKYGYINFKLRNTAMNLLFVDVLMLGESYHNNHHKHPSSVNFGQRWFEVDPVYHVIRLLSYIKIIRLGHHQEEQPALS
ncbi:acyl-CoA desaturase [Chitinophaga oryzae]|uniref:Acyl-CoA desaturase n=1 Tax=Chitinophaga oryzae TaxID=2725414 RepID=A0AAE6ZH10_9BACT|nr:acyl-CoA desaturase [Chitinophaga oryzae]QJB32531.1 acyl-CoA desaturase [Chitinophaga oryzae]QJB39006.1 acyl-CoA desaturase [Chitinophaga oryzae]